MTVCRRLLLLTTRISSQSVRNLFNSPNGHVNVQEKEENEECLEAHMPRMAQLEVTATNVDHGEGMVHN